MTLDKIIVMHIEKNHSKRNKMSFKCSVCVCMFLRPCKPTKLEKEIVTWKEINLGKCQPGQHLHIGSMKAFLNQNYIATDF